MFKKKDSYDVNNGSINNTKQQNDKQLEIAVVYHSLSANTQNALDRHLQTLENTTGSKHNSIVLPDNSSFRQIEDAIAHGFRQTTQMVKLNDNSLMTSTLAANINNNIKNKQISTSTINVCDCSTIKIKPIQKQNEKQQLQQTQGEEEKEKCSSEQKRPDFITNDHIIGFDEFLKKYETSTTNGLTKQQVDERRARDGINILKKKRKQLAIIKYVKELIGGYNFVMWLAAILCLLCYQPLGGDQPDVNNLVLSCLLFSAIFIQGTFSFFQHRRSDSLMASFEKLMPHFATVLRDGQWHSINTWELVVGDVVRLSAGEKIPADIRIIECSQASVEKSALTGEPEPVKLNVNSTDLNPYETKNIAMFGSSLLEGTATGIVFQTGERTVMGKIAEITLNTKAELTTMQREIYYFATVIGSMSIGTGLLTFIIWYFAVKPVYPDFLTYPGIITACIGVVVSFFPEGLPIAVTMTLTLIAKKMKKNNVLIKKMPIIETLGSTTVIASDKTGTITMNKMTLSHISMLNLHDESLLGPKINDLNKHYNMLLTLAGLCNKAIVEDNKETKKSEYIGSPTECGILKAVHDYIDINQIRLQNPIEFEIPFNSRYKYHLSLHKISNDRKILSNILSPIDLDDKTHICIIKGAPEVISELCAYGFNGQSMQEFQPIKKYFMDKAHSLATNGERVLALAYTMVTINVDGKVDIYSESNLPNDFCFYGLLSLIDPPRIGVADAVTKCHDGGIKVMMVTGDHPVTATSIARMVNIITSEKIKNFDEIKYLVDTYPEDKIKGASLNCQCRKISIFSKVSQMFLPKKPSIIAKKYKVTGAVCISGKDINEFDIEHWDYVLSHREIVFARTTPQNKLAIVQQLQRRGEIVTVTGDGINDAPALKKADIGIAMGIAGTEISKEAAKIIIMDDNFSTIVNGIEQGRLLFDNLKKVIGYLLPAGCFAEILPVLAFVFLGLPLPLTTLQMVIICLGTDTIGSLGIIYEHPESDLMKRKPRNASIDRLISFSAIIKIYLQTGMLQLIIAFLMYFYTMSYYRVDVKQLLFAYGNWNINGTFAGVSLHVRDEALHFSQTGFFVSLVMTQLINLLTVRTRFQTFFKQRFRPSLLLFMLGEVLIVLLFCYVKPLQSYFNSTNAKWYHFIFPFLLGLSIFLVDELKKLLLRKFPKTWLSNLVW